MTDTTLETATAAGLGDRLIRLLERIEAAHADLAARVSKLEAAGKPEINERLSAFISPRPPAPAVSVDYGWRGPTLIDHTRPVSPPPPVEPRLVHGAEHGVYNTVPTPGFMPVGKS